MLHTWAHLTLLSSGALALIVGTAFSEHQNGALDGRVPRHTYFHSSSSVHQQRGRPCAPGLARASGTPTYPPLPPSPSLTLPLPDAALHLPAPSVKDEKTETTNKRSEWYIRRPHQTGYRKKRNFESLLTVSRAGGQSALFSLGRQGRGSVCARARASV